MVPHIDQLGILNQQYQLQYHLLLGAFNPNIKGARALYQDEFCSQKWWADRARKDYHLLERFTHETTHTKPAAKDKKKAPSTTKQMTKRDELSSLLNSLISKHVACSKTSVSIN